MNNLQIDIKPVLQDVKESILKWMPDDVGFIYYFPDDSPDFDSKCYYFLISLKMNPDSFTIDFWMEYYKNLEIVWDKFWINQNNDERVPILSINFRSLESTQDIQSTSFFIDESPILLYENRDLVSSIMPSRKQDINECEMIWL